MKLRPGLQEAVDLIDALRLYLVQQALTDFQHDSRDDRESYVAAVLQTSQHWQAVLSSVRSGQKLCTLLCLCCVQELAGNALLASRQNAVKDRLLSVVSRCSRLRLILFC